VKLGVLHPGAMGVSVGAALVSNGHEVFWLPEGRSAATRERAEEHGFVATSTLAELVQTVSGIVSVCPPDGALALAEQVVDAGFKGNYLDANAVSPETARKLHALVGPTFVDGGIVGPPALHAGTTRLYLSGEGAGDAERWFAESNLAPEPITGPPGAASALKMCYAAYTKGTSALLLAIRALATAEGVDESLLYEWGISQPTLAARSEGAARGSAPKAWRFVGEMEEIAAAFAAQGLPGGFHLAAAELYARLEAFKDRRDCELSEVLEALQK
jgi:3-hydroxyisobutyrate dehydrogenase-like beta-hydroxyacid dehydrogenase